MVRCRDVILFPYTQLQQNITRIQINRKLQVDLKLDAVLWLTQVSSHVCVDFGNAHDELVG